MASVLSSKLRGPGVCASSNGRFDPLAYTPGGEHLPKEVGKPEVGFHGGTGDGVDAGMPEAGMTDEAMQQAGLRSLSPPFFLE